MIGELFDRKRAASPAAKRRAKEKAQREARKPKMEAIKPFLPSLDPNAKKDPSLVMKKNFLSIYDYLDNEDTDSVTRAKVFDSKKVRGSGTGGAYGKRGRNGGADEEEQSLKSNFDTDTFDEVNPYRRVATPPIPSVLSEKSDELQSYSDRNKVGEMYYHQALTAEGTAEMTWEEKVSLAKEVYARQYEKIQAEDATNKSGISYIGRKLQKLFPSAKVETIDEEGMDHWSLTSNERLLRLNQRVQMDMAKVDNLELEARFLNNSQWNVRDSLNVKSQEVFMDTAQSIIVRESALVKLDELLQEVEKEYYEYALLVLQAQALDIPVNSEQIISKKAKVLSHHQRIRVSLAGYRTATLTIAENIKKMRSICRAEVSIRNVEVLITWYGVNYAKKMLTDTKHLYKYSVLRFWLPFMPNTFMIPPHQLPSPEADDVDNDKVPMWHTEPTAEEFFDAKRALFDRWYQKHKQFVRTVKRRWEERERELARAREEAEREVEVQHQLREAQAAAAKPKSFYQQKLEAKERKRGEQPTAAPAPAPAPAHVEGLTVAEKGQDGDNGEVRAKEQEPEQPEAEVEVEVVAGALHHFYGIMDRRDYFKKITDTEGLDGELDAAAEVREDSPAAGVQAQAQAQAAVEINDASDNSNREVVEGVQPAPPPHVVAMDTLEADGVASVGDMSTSVLGQESAAELVSLGNSHDEHEEGSVRRDDDIEQGKGWGAIRDICSTAWSFKESDGMWCQGEESAPEFWKNYEYSPLLVETALGLFNLAPKAPLVPDIPFIERVLKAKAFTEAESKLFMVVADGRVYDGHGEESSTFGDKQEHMGLSPLPGRGGGGGGGVGHRVYNHHDSPSGKYNAYAAFNQGLGRTLSYNSVSKSTTLPELQQRQMNMCRDILQWTERDKELKRALITDLRTGGGRANTSIPPAGGISLEARSLAQASLSLDRSQVQSSSEILMIDTEAGTEMKFEFDYTDQGYDEAEAALGNTFTTQQYGQSFAGDDDDEDYDESTRPTRGDHTAPTTQGGSMSHFHTPITTAAGEQIHSSLNVGDHHKVIRKDKFGVSRLREIRQPSVYNKDWWVILLVTRLQGVVRRFQARKKVEMVRAAVHKVRCCIRIQACMRRVIAMAVAAKRKIEFQHRMRVLREELVFRHNCAIRITKFIRYCGNLNMGVKTTNSLLAYARAAAKREEREQRQSVYAQEGVSVKRPGSRKGKKGALVDDSLVSGLEGLGELTKDMRHAVRDIMKADARMECRLIPTPQDLLEQSLSISGVLEDDDASETSDAGGNAKKGGKKVPIQAKKRIFDVDAGLKVRAVKALYDPNAVYRTPAALMSAKERSTIIGDHVAKLKVLEDARIEKNARLRKSITAVFSSQRDGDMALLDAPESLEM